MKRPNTTTHDQVRQLIATADLAPPPAAHRGRGRAPIYKPMIDYALRSEGQAVVFGPFPADEDGKATAERIRTGCYSYSNEHPELLPEGKRLNFSVQNEGHELRLYAWVSDKTDDDEGF